MPHFKMNQHYLFLQFASFCNWSYGWSKKHIFDIRLTCIAPLAVPHYTTGDIDVGKYCIPKGTVVMPNLHRITRNPIAFKDPNTFNPERFLDSSGKYVKNDFNIPFGIGKYRFLLFFYLSYSKHNGRLLGCLDLGNFIEKAGSFMPFCKALKVIWSNEYSFAECHLSKLKIVTTKRENISVPIHNYRKYSDISKDLFAATTFHTKSNQSM